MLHFPSVSAAVDSCEKQGWTPLARGIRGSESGNSGLGIGEFGARNRRIRDSESGILGLGKRTEDPHKGRPSVENDLIVLQPGKGNPRLRNQKQLPSQIQGLGSVREKITRQDESDSAAHVFGFRRQSTWPFTLLLPLGINLDVIASNVCAAQKFSVWGR